MENMPTGFDVMSFMQPIREMYCKNSECGHYGFVTVVGIPVPTPEDNLLDDNKESKI